MEEHPEARFIVETISKAGFSAYYAGGWVRDYLLQHPSDDIDIATNAPPETIQALFEKTVPLGIAFGIVLVIVDGKDYEVATFRQDFDYRDGRRPTKVEFSTAEEDAKRRDFTINGMFFDPITNRVLDFVGGQEDLKKGIIRAIGDPHTRIQEDRLRMIRAIRMSCRFSFPIDPSTQAAIRAHASELFPAVAIERVVQELEKGHAFDKLPQMLLCLHEYDLLAQIFPALLHVSLEELKHRLSHLVLVPHEAPLIAFLLPLFPHFHLQDAIALCKRLKLSNEQVRFAVRMDQAKRLIAGHPSLWEWAHFYALDDSLSVLQSIGAKMEEHEIRRDQLNAAIRRIRDNQPLVSSADLQQMGISPGKEMGRLLKEAEQISINEGIESKDQLLKRLLNGHKKER